MNLTDEASETKVMITPKTVHERARRADRFQVIVFPLYSIIGFVRRSAAIAGMVNARVPENGRAEKGRITHARTPAPSMSSPRMMIKNRERFHEGAVKIYRES
jgi:hypothetical protein